MEELIFSMNTMWVLIAAALVFFMQAGFALVEMGMTRAKNATNILMKNLMDYVIGTIAFWFIGFGIMFGSANGWWGGFDFMSQNTYRTDMPDFSIPYFPNCFCSNSGNNCFGCHG